jgi:hypothetical protein
MFTERKKPAREKVLKKLKELKPLLEKRYGVKRLGLLAQQLEVKTGLKVTLTLSLSSLLPNHLSGDRELKFTDLLPLLLYNLFTCPL